MSSNQTKILFSLLIIAALLSGIALISMPGCNSNQADGGSNGNIEILDEDDTPQEDERNPKLGSPLDRLIEAEEQGEAEDFAYRHCIELTDGCVTVIIECEPGQAEAVAEAASDLGNVELVVRDLVQIVTPIPNLAALTDIPGVLLVRLPVYPVENE